MRNVHTPSDPVQSIPTVEEVHEFIPVPADAIASLNAWYDELARRWAADRDAADDAEWAAMMERRDAATLPHVPDGTPGHARVRLEVTMLAVTLKAYHVELCDGQRVWIPMKFVGTLNFPYLGARVTMHVPLWLFRKWE